MSELPAEGCPAAMSPPAKLRVLHIITRMSVGGAQENTLLTVEGLQRLPGYEADLLSGVDDGSEGDLLPRARESARVIVIPELFRAISPLHDLRALLAVYGVIRRGGYHIVHTHMSKAGVIGRIAARLAGTPIIVHTLHSLVFHPYQPWLVNRGWRLVKKLCSFVTDHYVSVSARIAAAAVDARVVPAGRVTTIYSGMELDWFLNAAETAAAARERFGLPVDAPVIGKIARLFPLKGHEQLLDAAPEVVRRHPDVRFLLIGDGVLRPALEARCRELGIERHVVFAGMLERTRIPQAISAMDIVVHTSLREGLARVLVQGLAMGRPCVAYNLDGAPEVVLHEQTGLLVEPESPGALAEAICRLIESPELRKTMGEAGRQHVDPAFRAETMVADIADLYATLAGRHRDRIDRFERRPAAASSD